MGLRKFGNVALLYKNFSVVVIPVCASIQCPSDVDDDDTHDDDDSISSSSTHVFLKFILAIIKSK
jgi:hypothetical protein